METSLASFTDLPVDSSTTVEEGVNAFVSYFKNNYPAILAALLIAIVGYFLTKLIVRIVRKALVRSRIDVSLYSFICAVVKVLLLTLVALTAAAQLGIPITSFVALFSAIGLAVSLAVKDGLTNVAGSLFILFSKPFGVGDYIEADDVSGTVRDIGLLYTRLNTPDNKRVFIPNGQITTAKIINYSAESERRLDLVFSISYSNDFEKAQRIIERIIQSSDLALPDPAPVVRMAAHQANSIDIACRIWVKTENFWDLNFYMYEQVKAEFDKNGIEIPYPQMDIHIINH